MNIEQVWRDYQQAIRAFLHSRVSNNADVDDILQEILIKTYNNLHTVKSQGSIKSWLFQIANHAIVDFYRDKGKSRDIMEDGLWYQDNHQKIEDALVPCLTPFIQALPEESAELLTSIDLHGQSQKEYAARLGISYSTLKSRVQKSRGQLRKLFDDCCHLSLDKHGNLIDCDLKSNGCKKC